MANLSDNLKCNNCGRPIQPGAGEAVCPHCLLALGLESGEEDEPETIEAESQKKENHRPAFGFRPGCIIGDYELLEEIGRGAMGVVYKARQVSLDRLVAVKMIKPEEIESHELVDRFLREIEVTAKLSHPNIVKTYAAGDFEGPPIICMELIQGTRLDKHIAQGGFLRPTAWPAEKRRAPREQGTAARIVAKLARAVHYAHQHGVLHRDIKPSNTLLDAVGEPYLTDFGLAKILGPAVRLTRTNVVMGSLPYMAPEQASGENELLSTAADIYSLGAVLYEMLTGRPPFRGDNPAQILTRLLTQPPQPPTELNAEVDRELAIIAMRCLEKDPQRRYKSAEAMAKDLERWLRHEPIKRDRSHAWENFTQWCRRNPRLALAEAAVFVLLVAVVGLLAVILHETRMKEEAKERQLRNTEAALESVWTNATQTFQTIRSDERRVTAGKIPSRLAPGTAPLVLGVHTHAKPRQMLADFQPVMDYLEAELGTPIDFTIYKGLSNAVSALVNGKVDFMRIGPAAYVLAQEQQTNLVLLAEQLHNGTNRMYGVIFTKPLSGISTLKDMRGRKFAFGDRDSTFGSILPRALLYRIGIHASDLVHEHFLSHPAVRDVLLNDNTLAAGAANSNTVAGAIADGRLMVITNMNSISFPWVGRANLPLSTVSNIRQSLLRLTATRKAANKILKPLDADLTGFQLGQPQDYKELESQMRDAALFEQ